MSNISWAQFGLFIAIATVLYYAVVLLFFFKNKGPVFSTIKNRTDYEDDNNPLSYKANRDFTVENDFIEKRVINKEDYIVSVSDQDLTNYHNDVLLNEIDINKSTPIPDNALTPEQTYSVKSTPFSEKEINTTIDFPKEDMDNSIVPVADKEQVIVNTYFVDKPIAGDKIPGQEKNNPKTTENSAESIEEPVLKTAEKNESTKKKPQDKSKDSIMHLLKPTVKSGKQ